MLDFYTMINYDDFFVIMLPLQLFLMSKLHTFWYKLYEYFNPVKLMAAPIILSGIII